MRGPAVSPGYFKQPEMTSDAFTDDGWFCTGDLGVLFPDGSLKVLGKIKNFVKLQGGQYVQLETLESYYSTSKYVQNANGGIFCFCDSEMTNPVALVQVNMTELVRWATRNNLPSKSEDDLAANPKAENIILERLRSTGKSAGLADHQLLGAVALITGSGPLHELTPQSPWSIQNGGLNATGTLERDPIQTVFDFVIDRLKAKTTQCEG